MSGFFDNADIAAEKKAGGFFDPADVADHSPAVEPSASGGKYQGQKMTPEQMNKPLGFPAVSPKDLVDPGAYDAYLRNLDVPIITPLARQAGDRLQAWRPTEGGYDERLQGIRDQREEQRMEDMRDYPTATGLAGVTGGMGLPSVAGKAKNLVGAAVRIGEQGAVGATDASLRGEDPISAGLITGGFATLPEFARVKNINRFFGGIPEEVQEYYLRNPERVKAAGDLPEIAKKAAGSRTKLSRDVSLGSGESYDMLKKSGYEMPLEDITEDIDGMIARIKDGGAYDRKSRGLVRKLSSIQRAVEADASLGPAERRLEASKVKSLISQLWNESDAYRRGIGEAKGTEYNLGAVREGTGQLNQRLKENVPEYGEKMDDVSAKTRAFKGIGNKLKDETSARNSVRRMMLGKDPEGLKALTEFDAAAGTRYGEELQDSFVKEQFAKERTNGSRRVSLGATLGEATGLPGAKAIGSMLGYGQDIYGGKVAQLLLDLSQTPYLGAAGQMLNKAAQKSPQAVLALHRWLMDHDRAYQSKIDALKGEETP